MSAIEAQSWTGGTRSWKQCNNRYQTRFVFEVPIAQSVRALTRKARGPGSNPGRDMLFFFAFYLLIDVKTLSGGVRWHLTLYTSLFIIINPISRTLVCVCPPLRLKVEPVAPDLESNVTSDVRPGVNRPGSSVGRALARNARGPGSNPGRDMLFFFVSWLDKYLLFDVEALYGGVLTFDVT